MGKASRAKRDADPAVMALIRFYDRLPVAVVHNCRPLPLTHGGACYGYRCDCGRLWKRSGPGFEPMATTGILV